MSSATSSWPSEPQVGPAESAVIRQQLRGDAQADQELALAVEAGGRAAAGGEHRQHLPGRVRIGPRPGDHRVEFGGGEVVRRLRTY